MSLFNCIERLCHTEVQPCMSSTKQKKKLKKLKYCTYSILQKGLLKCANEKTIFLTFNVVILRLYTQGCNYDYKIMKCSQEKVNN